MLGKLIPIFFIMQYIRSQKDNTRNNEDSDVEDDVEDNVPVSRHYELDIFDIDPQVYETLEVVRKWDIPKRMTFKKIKPGEQTTSTFNSIVLKERKVWYNCDFYTME